MDQTFALHDRFLRGLAKAPDGVAIRAANGEFTYQELHELALAWAGTLLAEAGSPKAVGVLAGKSKEAYAGILAGLYTGITMVPLQPSFPAARTQQMIEAAGVEALIADPASASALDQLRGEGVDIPAYFPPGADSAHRLARPRAVAPDDVAYILFTSGSTGKPKGVPVIHANTDHYFRLLDERYDFGPEDAFSQFFDLNFDCAMFDLFCAWGCGGTLVAITTQAVRDLPAFVRDNGITVWFSTPSAISLVRRLGGLHDLDGLRWSFFAGEAITCQDAGDWASAAPGSQVENIYGPTELTITVSRHIWTDDSERIAVAGVVPIGLVHEGHDWFLRDADGKATDTEGELCIAGPQLTAGYLDPAQDEGRFLEHNGKRFYRTGDRVRRADTGDLLYLGRLDNQVQVHGIRIELAEVDQALRECDGVEDAVTVAFPVDDSVELAAFYTGTKVSPAVLARALSRTLPQAVLPKRFTHLQEFPLNSNRKIDRTVLTRWALDR